ncbi:MAG: hypothetical protein KatS3mg129_2333 [Leptospiraceae bacterium]|nr:MAG: hypothetical protein KatS3mg129_2333 [Leptospiraceae bacterium]
MPIYKSCELYIFNEFQEQQAPYESSKQIIKFYKDIYLLSCIKKLQELKECEKKSKYIPDIYIE